MCTSFTVLVQYVNIIKLWLLDFAMATPLTLWHTNPTDILLTLIDTSFDLHATNSTGEGCAFMQAISFSVIDP